MQEQQISVGDKVQSGVGETQKIVVESTSSLLDYLQTSKKEEARKRELKQKQEFEKRKQAMAKKAELEIESTDIDDNLSISEIIAKKYTRKVHKIKSPEEAAKILIKDTHDFNINAEEYVDGTKEEQEQAQKQLGNIETNLASKWKDLGDVKQRLWEKIHKEVTPELQNKINNQFDSMQKK